MKKKTYIESEIHKFLEKYGDKNITISYDKDKDSGKYKNKFNAEEITKSLRKLRNKFINFNEFDEKYNQFTDNIVKFQYYKSEKEKGSVEFKPKKNEKICKRFKRYC